MQGMTASKVRDMLNKLECPSLTCSAIFSGSNVYLSDPWKLAFGRLYHCCKLVLCPPYQQEWIFAVNVSSTIDDR